MDHLGEESAMRGDCAKATRYPLLFVLVMEGLNALLQLADERRLLRALHPKIKERAFMYADDVVIFLTPH